MGSSHAPARPPSAGPEREGGNSGPRGRPRGHADPGGVSGPAGGGSGSPGSGVPGWRDPRPRTIISRMTALRALPPAIALALTALAPRAGAVAGPARGDSLSFSTLSVSPASQYT